MLQTFHRLCCKFKPRFFDTSMVQILSCQRQLTIFILFTKIEFTFSEYADIHLGYGLAPCNALEEFLIEELLKE